MFCDSSDHMETRINRYDTVTSAVLFRSEGLHIGVMVVSTVANMFLTVFQAVLIHVNTLITTSQA